MNNVEIPNKQISNPIYQNVEPNEKTKQKNCVPLISLFCGAGGLDLGFTQEGFESILALDNNSSAIETFNANFRLQSGVEMDLGTLRSSKFLNLVDDAVKCTGLVPRGVIGGPPCQGVSNSNVGAYASDPRNSLMTTYLRLLNSLEDRYEIDFFVFENVPGLLNDKNKVRFTKLRRELSKRFHLNVQQVDAVDFGVPQHRERVLIFGLNRKRYAKPLEPLIPLGEPEKSVRTVISHLVDPVFYSKGLDSAKFPVHPNHWTMNPKSMKFKQPTESVGRSFRKLNWDLPSNTVAYGHREIHIHPSGHRRLSIYEGLLLQGFPSTFELKGTLSAQVQQVSNAVPPPLARAIAKQIRLSLKGD